MEFFWFGLLFWLLIGVSSLLLLYGLWLASWKALFISGLAILVPSLYFLGAENWLRIVVVLPIFPFLLAYRMKKRI
ncbi:hypothetical protein ACTQ5K_03300 [Niallia sp. Sow4_A1]|jgi:hypothetical protein|uniref:hypothetical protein n=1 Tax=Bacillaceae TaxID=186817 RepID=UPI0004E1D33B|nr:MULTISPECIES: hypothetical protein [Bacillaceae]MCF2650492.1 hypothetical protein [Niallia circulans]MCM3364752.1 hypothetical protein [Niallia sp. MER TA 168]CAI9391526.1 hypothetical protein BACSP_03035 [Bacillus sp. T2.9-1]